MNGNLFICEDNHPPEAAIPLQYRGRSAKSGFLEIAILGYMLYKLKSELNIVVDRKIIEYMLTNNLLNTFRVDKVLFIAAFDDNGITKYIDLRTGKLRDITDVELIIAEFEYVFDLALGGMTVSI